jgi:hypothetical protein
MKYTSKGINKWPKELPFVKKAILKLNSTLQILVREKPNTSPDHEKSTPPCGRWTA